MSEPEITAKAGKPAGPSRRRNPWIALLLSLLATGAGQIYDGRWRKGVAFFAADLALGVAVGGFLRTFAGLAAGLVLLLALNIYALADAVVGALRSASFRPGRWNRGWVYAMVVLAGLGSGWAVRVVIETNWFRTYRAPSGSMVPTLLVGDYFMAENLSRTDAVARGDVVVFWERESGRHFVKRVVGLPGETVSIADRRVVVDGRPCPDPHAFHVQLDTVMPMRDVMDPVTLGPEEYFVMGDNREYSYDSRWLGPIGRADIEARALYVYLPGPGPDGRWSRLGAPLR